MTKQTTSQSCGARPRRPRSTFPDSLIGSLRTLDGSRTFLHRRLFERLKYAIVSGQIAAGTKLPSTRSLAAELNISRNTILTAYELLTGENLVETLVGGGTTVKALSAKRIASERQAHNLRSPNISPLDIETSHTSTHGPFRVGIPAYDRFPFRAWNATIIRCARAQAPENLAYQVSRGHTELRRLLAAYLLTRRGLRCDIEQIIIVPGYQAGLTLAARTLLTPGDEACVEDPGHVPSRNALRSLGLTVRPVPVDCEGMRTDLIPSLWPKAKLAVVTPVHQFPLGMSLSLERRRSIQSWAQSSRAWIIEDDYDTEFHFAGNPPDSLADGTVDDRTIYIGTFSKVLFPSLRIAYIVVPRLLVEQFAMMRTTMDGHQPFFMQDVLARFIREGHFDRHLGRMRSLYRARQHALISAISERAGGRIRPIRRNGGTHLAAFLNEHSDDVAFSEAAKGVGVDITPLSHFRIQPGVSGLVLGFSNCSTEALNVAMHKLKDVLSSEHYPKRIANEPSTGHFPS
ncbi:GntR family transcriptional regulator/MocR family aminotransferase [Nitrobacteraceae bacterium AZCC 1564]